MEKTNEKQNTQKPIDAHANFRKGLNDYNDGANVTHHLGNDSYDGASIPEEKGSDEDKLDGSVAEGNGLTEEDLEDET
ncbi:MAG TPA: hypothetical protein VNJ01_08595 [Bacteriovoracaceae bacterium]|nr:hypothetical protein [Bacteriovoracaceae bacterium]